MDCAPRRSRRKPAASAHGWPTTPRASNGGARSCRPRRAEAVDMLLRGHRPAGPRTAWASSAVRSAASTRWCWASATAAAPPLLNPAVNPARDLVPAIGEHRLGHATSPSCSCPDYIDELRALAPPGLARPQNYLVGHRHRRRGARLARDGAGLPGRPPAHRRGSDHQLSGFRRAPARTSCTSSAWGLP